MNKQCLDSSFILAIRAGKSVCPPRCFVFPVGLSEAQGDPVSKKRQDEGSSRAWKLRNVKRLREERARP